MQMSRTGDRETRGKLVSDSWQQKRERLVF